MNDLTNLYAVAAVLAGALAAIAIGAPRHLWIKSAALAVAGALMVTGYAAFASLLSRPKPISLEWWHAHAEEAVVIGAIMEEGAGIYLWLQLPGETVPGAYTLPWSTALAEQLQRAQREAEEDGGGVILRQPFEPSWDDREPKAYALPQPAMPPKDLVDPPPPEIYERPGTDA